MMKRAKLVLDRIFQDDHDDTCALTSCLSQMAYTSAVFKDISITSHSGWIKSVLRVLGRGDYDILTGGTYLLHQRS